MNSAPESRYARCGDLHIAYQLIGQGPIDLLFTGQFVVSCESCWEEPAYAGFLERLASFSRLILLDRRGTGLSDPVSPGEAPTHEQYADDVLAVLDAAKSSRAAVLGFGGPAAAGILFAAAHPERTSALVLVNAFARQAVSHDYPWGITLADPPEADADMRDWGRPEKGFVQRRAPSRADDPEFIEWLGRAMRRGVSPATAVAITRVIGATDIRSVLGSVRVPTLVIHRRGNAYAVIEHGRYIAANIPGAHLVELEGEDHFFWTGDTELMLAEIEHFLTGVRPEPAPSRTLATILFSDIVSSTEHLADAGDRRWIDLLNAHDRGVRRQLERFRGREVDTTGDGFLAIFDGPARAIQCAAAILDAVHRLGLQVRFGVHTGEVEHRGGGVAGIAVHIGQRVSALAGPGEILVSRTVTDLVAGSGLEFQDRGEHELKGVPGRWRLYAAKP